MPFERESLFNFVQTCRRGPLTLLLDYDVVQPFTGRDWRIASLAARIGPRASLSSRSVCLGGPLVRNDVLALLDADGADCTLDGLFLVRAGEHVDNHTVIDHDEQQGHRKGNPVAIGGHDRQHHKKMKMRFDVPSGQMNDQRGGGHQAQCRED